MSPYKTMGFLVVVFGLFTIAPRAEAQSTAAPAPTGVVPRAQMSPPMRSKAICESSAGKAVSGTASGSGPEVGQIRLGMTREEAVAVCCMRPHVMVQERYVATNQKGEEESVEPDSSGAGLLEAPYLAYITCGSGAGITQIGFLPPPSDNRVSDIQHMAYLSSTNSSSSSSSSLEAYLAALSREYGAPKAQLGPDVIEAALRSVAHEYKWLFPHNAQDRDCTTPMREYNQSTFGRIPPDNHPCATQLTVHIASNPTSVFSANFHLFNEQELNEVHDRHVAALNNRHGTHFPDALTVYTRAIEAGKQEEVAKKQEARAEAEAERRANMTPQQLVEEQNSRDARDMFNGIMRIGVAAAAADQAAASRNRQNAAGQPRTNTGAPPGQRENLGEKWAAEKAERQRQCHQRCEQSQSTGCQYGENETACRDRNSNQLSSCHSSCPD
jgi:hypothetical protein